MICQSCLAITGDLNKWIQELVHTLTSDFDMFGKEWFAESKVQALGMKINLTAVSQVHRVFTDEDV